MSRRTSLPGADELFRSTEPAAAPAEPASRRAVRPEPAPRRPVERPRRTLAERPPTGREKHDEKITVYVSSDELMDLEHGRLLLRGEHGLAVDRGRIVREAVAVVLADLEANGESSVLVQRLRGQGSGR